MIGGFVSQASNARCEISSGSADLDMDGSFSNEMIVPASGTCSLQSNRTEFILEDLVLNHVPLGVDLKAICGGLPTPLITSDKRTEQANASDLSDALLEAMIGVQQGLGGDLRNDEEAGETENEPGLIEEFQQKLEK